MFTSLYTLQLCSIKNNFFWKITQYKAKKKMYLLTKLASNAESLWLHNYKLLQYYKIEITTNKLETRNRSSSAVVPVRAWAH